MLPIIDALPLEKGGWKESNGTILPVWYTCTQFPPIDKGHKRVINEPTSGKISTDEPDCVQLDKTQSSYVCQSTSENLSNQSNVNNDNEVDEFDENDEGWIYETDEEWEHLSDFDLTDDSCSDDSDWEG